MVDLRRLRVLRAVAEFGTVTAAAEALHTTTSAASQQIRQLGREVGIVLLEPRGRGVVLTARARELLTHADEIDRRWERAHAALHRAEEPAGPLFVCGIPTAVVGLIAPAATNLAHQYAGMDVTMSEAEPDEGARRVLIGTADVAVFEVGVDTPRSRDDRFHIVPLCEDPFDLVLPPDHWLAEYERPTLMDAAEEPWVLEWSSSSSHYATIAACAAAGFSPAVAHQARQWGVVAALVGHGHGVALVPRLANLPEEPAVTRRHLHGRVVPTRRIVCCVRSGSQHHPTIAATIAALQAVGNR